MTPGSLFPQGGSDRAMWVKTLNACGNNSVKVGKGFPPVTFAIADACGFASLARLRIRGSKTNTPEFQS